MKVVVIVNPLAGKGRTRQKWPQINEALAKTGWKLETRFSTYPGHARVLAQQAVNEGADKIIAVGGDGTLNEVVNGMAFSEVELGLIPTGTGNDFARAIGLSQDPLQAVIQVCSGSAQPIDLGAVNDRYFINVCGLGIDARVAYLVNRSSRYVSGHLAYLLALARVFLSYRPFLVSLETDGGVITKNVILVAVGNANFYGGGLKITPNARLDDGKLDICIVEDVSRWEFLREYPGIYHGKHVNHPKVSTFRAGSIKIQGDAGVYTHVDGEIYGHLPLDIDVKPQALSVIMPVDK